MSVEAVRSRREVIDLLHGDLFKQALARAALATAESFTEEGFVIYRKEDGRFSVREVDTSKRRTEGRVYGENDTIDFSSLIRDREDNLRDDMVMTLHAHPISTPGNPVGRGARSLARPSYGDILGFEEVESKNPGHLDAVVATDWSREIAYIMLWRKADRTRPNYYQRFGSDAEMNRVGFERFLQTMRQSGIGIMQVAYDLRTARYKTGNVPISRRIRGLFDPSIAPPAEF